MTEWVLNRVEWEALEFTPRSLFTGVRGMVILRSWTCVSRSSRNFGGGAALVVGVSWFNHVVMAMDRPR
jgi:hypothetical protein